jgi:sugar lactone lactonase YvrE
MFRFRFLSMGFIVLLAACSGGVAPGPAPLARASHISPSSIDTANVQLSARRIYLTNGPGSSVSIYNGHGVLVNTITAGISGPLGIAVDLSGKIHVANPGNGTVTTYSPNGKQTTPTITGFNSPYGIAVDVLGKIYVTDTNNNTLKTYKPDGTQTTPTITGLQQPEGVAVGLDGKIYVANVNGEQTFTQTGASTTPTITGISYPGKAIALGLQGQIYFVVQNPASADMLTFAASGAPSTPTITTNSYLVGVAIVADGTIYLAAANSVSAYNQSGTLINGVPVISGVGLGIEGIAVR